MLDDRDHLQTAVLDWCLQNAIRLQSAELNWTVLSYELLVLQTDFVVQHLADTLCLPSPETIINRIFIASGSTGKSIEESKCGLLNPDQLRQNRIKLVDRWKAKVKSEQVVRAFDTLPVFGTDYYEYGNLLPGDCYILGLNGDGVTNV